eukprot:4285515-Pyramimonas_sp.AAC.2
MAKLSVEPRARPPYPYVHRNITPVLMLKQNGTRKESAEYRSSHARQLRSTTSAPTPTPTPDATPDDTRAYTPGIPYGCHAPMFSL